MRILFIGYPSPFNIGLAKAFKENGADLIYLSDRNVEIMPGIKIPKLWSLIRKFSFLKKINNYFFNKKIVRICKNIKPDAMVTTKGTTIKTDTLDVLRELDVITVNWFPENLNNKNYLVWFEKTHRHYRYFYGFDSSLEKKYKSDVSTKIGYMPFGVDENAYRVLEKNKDIYDVSFVGAYYPEREELLSKIIQAGIDVRIYGWKQWKESRLKEYYHGPLDLEGMKKVFSSSKINLNMNIYPRNSGANNRTFEIPASGGFQLSDNQEDIANLFEIGKEIAVFSDYEDAISKIRYFLKNENERINIAKAGRERVIKSHTLNERAKKIIKDIGL